MSHPSAARWTPLGTGVALLTALLVACGCGGTSDPARTQAARSSGTASPTVTASGTFVSKALPYQLVLPEGWSVDPISQGASSGGDEFVNADGSERLVVGHGYPEAGETLADRVRVNRSDEVGHGCSSEPKQDRPIRVGGQRGTLWSYTCEADASYHLSAQTIYRRAGHRRVGYRFTVQVPQDRKGQAKALMDRFLAGLTFLNASAATGDA